MIATSMRRTTFLTSCAILLLAIAKARVTQAALIPTLVDSVVDSVVAPVVRNAVNITSNGLVLSKSAYQCLIPTVAIDPDSVQPTLYFFSSANRQNNAGFQYDERLLYSQTQQYEESKWKQQFNSTWPSYFFIHGFMASWNEDLWMVQTKDLIFNKTKEANVFVIDWSAGSKPPIPGDYPRSVACTYIVASQLSEFVDNLIKTTGANSEHMQFIGHSLGAHISGFVGQNIQKSSSGDNKLGRITALDPAGPCFGILTPTSAKLRLNRDDALIVTALHTNTYTFGLNENLADFDVYINGGDSQPGCPTAQSKFSELLTLQMSEFVKNFQLACSHSYSHDLIKPDLGYCQSVAYKCSSYRMFKLGECGQCDATNNNCHLSGLQIQSTIPENFEQYDDTLYDLAPEEWRLLQSGNKSLDDRANSAHSSETDAPTGNVGDIDSEVDDDNNNNLITNGQTTDNKDDDDDDDGQSGVENDLNDRNERRYYVRTSSESPYCLYLYQIVIKLNERVARLLSSHVTYQVELRVDDDTDKDNGKKRLVKVKHLVSYQYRQDNSVGDDEDVMTTLLTFRVTKSSSDEQSVDERSLISPKRFDKIKLLAHKKSLLTMVKSVQINYLSDINYKRRQALSSVYDVSSDVNRDQSPKKKRKSSSKFMRSCMQNWFGCATHHGQSLYELKLQSS